MLAERHIDGSACTVLNWVQTFGPQFATALSHYRRRVGRRGYGEEVFGFRGGQKRYLYRAVDQEGQVIDILPREKRGRASAEAFFRRILSRIEPYTENLNRAEVYLNRCILYAYYRLSVRRTAS